MKMLQHSRSSVLLFITMLALAGCQSINPMSIAETPAQKAYALERSYNIVLAGALDLVNDPAVPAGVKSNIRSVERRTTPIVDNLSQAFADYTVARAALSSGTGSQERIEVIAANLEGWIKQAERAIVELANAVDR